MSYGLTILIAPSFWFNYIKYVGLTIYFIVVLMRIYIKKGNIKVANYILIISFLLQAVVTLFRSPYALAYRILPIIYYIIFGLYLCNILLRKTRLVNNKIFAIATAIFIIYQIVIPIFNTLRYSTFEYNYIITYSIVLILYILIVPYFYNYYRLLKGGDL